MRLPSVVMLGVALSLSLASSAQARPARINQIPNGTINSCANCHINPAGGGPRNPFGTTIETSFLSVPGSTGVVLWGPALAALDSDSDGRSNGLELQDPAGAWVQNTPAPGNPALVTLPGTFNAPLGVPGLSTVWSALLALSLVLFGLYAHARRAREHARAELAASLEF
jgi:hypothetical protein